MESCYKTGAIQEASVIQFFPFRLDLTDEQLWRGSERIPLPPKPFAILRYLVEHPDQLVTKKELLTAVWPGIYVDERGLTAYIWKLRHALKDDSKVPRFIKTVGKLGYRFIGAVQETAPDREMPVDEPNVPPTSLSPILVGGEQELVQLRTWLQKARQGTRQVVFITGEPGIGKTALVEAFLTELAGSKTIWLERGQCIEQNGAGEAYLPILEAVGRLCRRPEGKRFIDILRQYAPTWLVQMPALVADAEFEMLQRKIHGTTQERMLCEMAEALEIFTANVPLVIVLEDLQWCDLSSLDLLAYIAQRRGIARLLVVGTYRPADVIVNDHPLEAVKQELHTHGWCEELPLSFLAKAEVAEYLSKRFPGIVPPPWLLHVIHQRTEGNPSFWSMWLITSWRRGLCVRLGSNGSCRHLPKR